MHGDAMPTYSIEELKRIIRKMEFNKTEPELLTELVHRAIKVGGEEKERLKHVSKRSHKLFELLRDEGFFYQVEKNEDIETLKKIPAGAVDGSFQVIGGIGGRWYVMIGVAQVIAESGFTLQPTIFVDGSVEPLDSVDESDAYRSAEVTMMLGEISALRRIVEKLRNRGESYVLIDGPIIDPPMYNEENYVEERVSALRLSYEEGINVIGFVKRIMGRSLLKRLRSEVEEDLIDFINDLDLLSTVMFDAVKSEGLPIYTYPVDLDEATSTYNAYKDKGLHIYYSYYKPSLRGRIFRIEYVSFKPLKEQELLEKFHRVMYLINQVWTLPGLDEPLLITMAHNKCNVRRGAAETIYYEIMTKALSEGNLHLWFESLSQI